MSAVSQRGTFVNNDSVSINSFIYLFMLNLCLYRLIYRFTGSDVVLENLQINLRPPVPLVQMESRSRR